MLTRLSGRQHLVHTGVTLIVPAAASTGASKHMAGRSSLGSVMLQASAKYSGQSVLLPTAVGALAAQLKRQNTRARCPVFTATSDTADERGNGGAAAESTFSQTTRVQFDDLSSADIQAYVATGWISCILMMRPRLPQRLCSMCFAALTAQPLYA